jgi:predicted O-methyltransferase YrrM
MSPKTLALTDELHAYLVTQGSEPDAVARELIAETYATWPEHAQMLIAPEQAAFFTLVARLLGARRAVEIGTFTGYSALALARGLAPDGRLTCLDISETYTALARRYWARAGVADRVELRLGPAADTVRELPEEPGIDLAFIDADKAGYPTYWAELVPRMRPGGVLFIDNVLRDGAVLNPSTPDDHAIVAFNSMVRGDNRVDAVMLPIGDGLTMARRR